MKPVGLDDPKTGRWPYAVVQLRQDNAAKSLYNLVGFQTHLKYQSQKELLNLIPGLEKAEIVRYGMMHRNTYINSRKLLNNGYQLLKNKNIFFAGQITGVDQNHGAIFYLTEKSGAVVKDLSFELKSGTTNRMDCSETIITEFENPTTLLVRCGIIGDSSTANIDFANVNLIIKKYNV